MARAIPFLIAAALAAAALLSIETGSSGDKIAKHAQGKCSAAVCAMSIF